MTGLASPTRFSALSEEATMSVDSSDFSPESIDPDEGVPDAGAAPGDRADRIDEASAGEGSDEQARQVADG
jgi:hypothetical protein